MGLYLIGPARVAHLVHFEDRYKIISGPLRRAEEWKVYTY